MKKYRHSQTVLNSTTIPTQTIQLRELTWIRSVDDPDGLGIRLDRTLIKEIKIHAIDLYAYGRTEIEDRPLYVNVAVVAPKGADIIATTDVTQLNHTTFKQLFFNPTGLTALDFSNTLKAIDLHNLPLNNHTYEILFEHRAMLYPSRATGTEHRNGNQTWIAIEKRIKLNDFVISISPTFQRNRPIYLMYWCSKVQTAGAAASGMVMATRAVVHWEQHV